MPRELFGEGSALYPEDSGLSQPRIALGWETQGLDSSPGLAHRVCPHEALCFWLGLCRLVLVERMSWETVSSTRPWEGEWDTCADHVGSLGGRTCLMGVAGQMKDR